MLCMLCCLRLLIMYFCHKWSVYFCFKSNVCIPKSPPKLTHRLPLKTIICLSPSRLCTVCGLNVTIEFFLAVLYFQAAKLEEDFADTVGILLDLLLAYKVSALVSWLQSLDKVWQVAAVWCYNVVYLQCACCMWWLQSMVFGVQKIWTNTEQMNKYSYPLHTLELTWSRHPPPILVEHKVFPVVKRSFPSKVATKSVIFGSIFQTRKGLLTPDVLDTIMDRFSGVWPISDAAVFRHRSRHSRCIVTTITTVWRIARSSYCHGSSVLDRQLHAYIRTFKLLSPLISQPQFMVPRHRRSTFGRRAFSVADLMEWNSLPHSLWDPA